MGNNKIDMEFGGFVWNIFMVMDTPPQSAWALPRTIAETIMLTFSN
jgi:hypothetical protein